MRAQQISQESHHIFHKGRNKKSFTEISRLQKGPAERGHVKKRQKSPKSVKKFFDTFRQFSCRAKNVKNRQKVPKSFSTLFDNFRAAPCFRPLLGGSDERLMMHRPCQKAQDPPKQPNRSKMGQKIGFGGFLLKNRSKRGQQYTNSCIFHLFFDLLTCTFKRQRKEV